MAKPLKLIVLPLLLALLAACSSVDEPSHTAGLEPLYGNGDDNEMFQVDAHLHLSGRVAVSYGIGGQFGCDALIGFSRRGSRYLTLPLAPLGYPRGGSNVGCELASDEEHNLYAALETWEASHVSILKFNAFGGLVWERDLIFGVRLPSLAGLVAADDRLYAAGTANHHGDNRTFVSALNLDGTILWTRFINTSGTEVMSGIAADSAGNVYVAGWTTGSLAYYNPGGVYRDLFVRKYDRDGRTLWTKQFFYGSAHALTPTDISLTSSGLYVGGTVGYSSGYHADEGFLYKFSTSGRLLWTRFVRAAPADRIHAVASDFEGSAYVLGESRGSAYFELTPIFVKKYREDGTLEWERRYHGTKGLDIDALSPDEIYIVGQTHKDLGAGYAGNGDGFLRRLDGSGRVVWTR